MRRFVLAATLLLVNVAAVHGFHGPPLRLHTSFEQQCRRSSSSSSSSSGSSRSSRIYSTDGGTDGGTDGSTDVSAATRDVLAKLKESGKMKAKAAEAARSKGRWKRARAMSRLTRREDDSLPPSEDPLPPLSGIGVVTPSPPPEEETPEDRAFRIAKERARTDAAGNRRAAAAAEAVAMARAKAKVEAEMKAKAEAEAKAKLDAGITPEVEARMKEEEEARMKAQAKAQAEADAKAKAAKAAALAEERAANLAQREADAAWEAKALERAQNEDARLRAEEEEQRRARKEKMEEEDAKLKAEAALLSPEDVPIGQEYVSPENDNPAYMDTRNIVIVAKVELDEGQALLDEAIRRWQSATQKVGAIRDELSPRKLAAKEADRRRVWANKFGTVEEMKLAEEQAKLAASKSVVMVREREVADVQVSNRLHEVQIEQFQVKKLNLRMEDGTLKYKAALRDIETGIEAARDISRNAIRSAMAEAEARHRADEEVTIQKMLTLNFGREERDRWMSSPEGQAVQQEAERQKKVEQEARSLYFKERAEQQRQEAAEREAKERMLAKLKPDEDADTEGYKAEASLVESKLNLRKNRAAAKMKAEAWLKEEREMAVAERTWLSKRRDYEKKHSVQKKETQLAKALARLSPAEKEARSSMLPAEMALFDAELALAAATDEEWETTAELNVKESPDSASGGADASVAAGMVELQKMIKSDDEFREQKKKDLQELVEENRRNDPPPTAKDQVDTIIKHTSIMGLKDILKQQGVNLMSLPTGVYASRKKLAPYLVKILAGEEEDYDLALQTLRDVDRLMLESVADRVPKPPKTWWGKSRLFNLEEKNNYTD